LVYEVEKLYHGTPSGIDNNVITCARPVYFIREKPVEILAIKSPFTVVIGNTGIRSPTAMAVAELRNAWQTEPEHYESIFTAVEKLVKNAKKAIESGNVEALGPLMDENQALLAQMGVSSNELDNLVQAARDAGAMGAKLSGGGRGGNMIAIVKPELAQRLSDRLLLAGATNTIITEVR
jgi:mevalonate kinase